jgi:WD40 repeat protein
MYRVPSYSSDGRFVALPSGHSGDWTWQILDVLTGKKIRTSLRGGAPALVRVHLTRDGKRLVAVMSDNATWNVYDESGDMPSAVVTHGTPSFLSRLELSPDGQFLAWMAPKEKDGKTPEVHVWDINAKKEKWKFDGPDLHSFPEIAFSPDGRYLAIPGNPLLVWDLVQGKVHPTPEQDGKKVAPVRCVFSADSKLMVCDDTLWDVTTAKQHCVLEGPRAPYYHLNFLFSPDGKTLAAIGVDNAIRTWDTTTGKLKNAVQPLLHLMAVSADGGKIAVMDRSVANRLMIKDMIDSKNDLVLTLPKGQGFYAVQFGEEGRKLAAIFTTGQGCRVYDLTKKDDDAFASYGHLGASNIAFAQDGKTLVTGDHGSGGIKIWDVATKKERRIVAPPKKPHYVRIALTADGKTLAYTTDAGVRVEETATGKTITTLKAELPYENSGRLCFSQDGKRLAYYSYPGGQVWDLATGKTLPYAALFDRGFAFGPDGKALLSGDRDGRIVQFAEREERAWELPGVVTGLATTADGRYLFTSNMNGTIYVFRLAERLPDAK